MYLPARSKKEEAPKAPTIPRVKRDVLLSQSSHTITMSGNRYTCTVCKNSFKATDPGCWHWLATRCIPPIFQSRQHAPAKFNGSVHIGNRVSHISHNLYCYRGIIYCKECGARTGNNQIRNLGSACEPPGTGGLAVLRAIELGKKPPGVKEWPAEHT